MSCVYYYNIIAEAKSATIRRMQGNLEDWNKQLKEIMDKKEKDGNINKN